MYGGPQIDTSVATVSRESYKMRLEDQSTQPFSTTIVGIMMMSISTLIHLVRFAIPILHSLFRVCRIWLTYRVAIQGMNLLDSFMFIHGDFKSP